MELGFACITGRTRSCLELYLEHITGGNWIMVELGLLVELAFLKNVYSLRNLDFNLMRSLGLLKNVYYEMFSVVQHKASKN